MLSWEVSASYTPNNWEKNICLKESGWHIRGSTIQIIVWFWCHQMAELYKGLISISSKAQVRIWGKVSRKRRQEHRRADPGCWAEEGKDSCREKAGLPSRPQWQPPLPSSLGLGSASTLVFILVWQLVNLREGEGPITWFYLDPWGHMSSGLEQMGKMTRTWNKKLLDLTFVANFSSGKIWVPCTGKMKLFQLPAFLSPYGSYTPQVCGIYGVVSPV